MQVVKERARNPNSSLKKERVLKNIFTEIHHI